MCSVFSSAQNINGNPVKNIDSLQKLITVTENPQEKIRLLNQVADEYLYTTPHKGISCSEEALKIAEKKSLQKEAADSYECLGKLYLAQQDFHKAMDAFNKSSSIYKKINKPGLYWNIRREIGQVYYEMGEFPKAMEFFFSALKYYEKNKDSDGIVNVLNNIGVLFHRQNNVPKSLQYYNDAISILMKKGDSTSSIFCRVQTNMGLSYAALKNYKKAEACYLRSLKANEKTGNLLFYTVNIGNLAGLYAALKDYKKAEKYFKEAIGKSKEMSNNRSVAVNYGDLGTLYLDMAENENKSSERNNLINKAIESLHTSLKILQQYHYLRYYQNYSQELSRAYELKGDFKNALQIYKEHTLYKDSVFNDENTRGIARREISYEFSKREDSIRLQSEKEIAVRDATLSANKKQKWLLFSGMFLLGIIGILLFYQSYVRKRNNEKLSELNRELNEANQIKARFFGILNHDLRSPVSNIIKFIRLQQNKEIQLDEQTRERLGKQTVSSAEKLLSSMEDLLLWSKGQMENFRPQFKETEVQDLFDDLKVFFDSYESPNIVYENSEKLFLTTDENYLKTIMRNLTFNALKVLENKENPELKWSAYQNAGNKIVSITDNGGGGTAEQFRALYDDKYSIGIQSGLGLHLVRDMVKAIGCSVKVDSQLEKGTVISLIFAEETQS